MRIAFSILAVITTMSAQPLFAGVCDYRPSAWIGTAGTTAITATTGTVTGIAIVGEVAGLYVMTHATTGAVMLGSTAGGASAAGTVGIMGGTAGAGSAAVGFILNPFLWIPAAIVTIGTVGLEGSCYLAGAE